MTGATGFRGFLQRFFFPDVETLLTASEDLDQRLDRVDKNVGALDKNIGALDKSVVSLDASLALLVDQGMARLNDGMRQLDQNMGRIHKGMVQLNLGMDQLNKDTDDREKDLSTRLTVLKAKLEDDHTRAMGEIAALLEEHAYTERQEANTREAKPASPVGSLPPQPISIPQPTPLRAPSESVPLPATAAAAAISSSPPVPVPLDPTAAYARPVSQVEAAVAPRVSPSTLPLANLTFAQQRDEELEGRAEALADPVATINRLSALFGRPKASDAFAASSDAGHNSDATLDFAAILEGIKRSGIRESQTLPRIESRAL